MMNVLITSIGSNTAIGVVKALRFVSDPNIKIFGTDIFPSHQSAGSGFVDKFFQINSVRNESAYEIDIINIITTEGINCVIPIHDLEVNFISLLSLKYPKLSFWAVNHPSLINIANNKILSNQFAQKAGLSVPLFAEYNGEQINFNKFPAIIKQIDGVSSRGMFIVFNSEELILKVSKLKSPHLIQELIQNGIEYTVDCYSDYNGKFIGGVARERVETKEGMSTKGRVVHIPELIEQCEKFLTLAGYKGACNIQFIIKDDKYYFIEINPRFSGGGILSFKAGFNSPYYTINEAKGEKINKGEIHYGLSMTRYWEEFYFDEKGNRF